MSLINHGGDLLYFGHYVSDLFGDNTGIWWHCDDDNFTQISDLSKGVYIRETHKKIKKVISGSTDALFVVYIRTSHMTKHSSIFQEFTNISKLLI